jgi:hypothetical protein
MPLISGMFQSVITISAPVSARRYAFASVGRLRAVFVSHFVEGIMMMRRIVVESSRPGIAWRALRKVKDQLRDGNGLDPPS